MFFSQSSSKIKHSLLIWPLDSSSLKAVSIFLSCSTGTLLLYSVSQVLKKASGVIPFFARRILNSCSTTSSFEMLRLAASLRAKSAFYSISCFSVFLMARILLKCFWIFTTSYSTWIIFMKSLPLLSFETSPYSLRPCNCKTAVPRALYNSPMIYLSDILSRSVWRTDICFIAYLMLRLFN